jgi:8-oxo-dGTP pyrophosphatase MutT (NUDIX family)
MKTAPAIPRPAATLLLMRDGPGGLEVLMVRRAREMDFAAGALVFPGGRVEDADGVLAQGQDALGAHRIAAIREAWEECGILLAHPPAPPAQVATAFGEHLAERGLTPDGAALVHFAHWVTPEHSAKRFDTHFFIARTPDGQEPVHDGREAVEAVWVTPAAVLADAAAGRRKLVFATRLNLQRLAAHTMVTEALASAARRPVVTVTPRPVPDGQGGTILRIPAEAGYGGDEFPALDAPAMGGAWPGATKSG